SQFIHYDGYWHVFIATQDRWALFLSEWQIAAHPPLYYVLLRIVGKMGHAHLVYRSLSIIPGVGSVYVIGLIARKLCRSTTIALLTAAAYGFSITIIDITCDVRAYALALFLILLAFYYFLKFLLDECQQKQVKRSLALFGIFTTAAISVEYYAIFFWAACLGVVLLNALWDAEFQKTKLKWLIREWYEVVPFLIGIPACMLVYLYEVHSHFHHLRPERHLIQFYWNPSRPITEFILQGVREDLNYILPIGIPSTTVLLVSLVPVVALIWFFIRREDRKVARAASTAPILLLVLLFSELIVLAVIGRYPFGGEARQQSIIFPFVVLNGFLGLDRSVSFLRFPLMKKLVVFFTAALITVSFCCWWPKYPKITQELFTPEYNLFASRLHPTQAVYIDRFSSIAYYIHTHTWKWQFQNHFVDPKRVDSYGLTTPSGEHLILLRNRQWNFDLRSSDFYTDLAKSLRAAQVSGADLFYIANLDQAVLAVTQEAVRVLADRAGLTAGPILRENDGMFIAFRLK
ncbi:MAG TPA: phospholipid carrier-dependent glycosyltransferase, partial [Ktedonobacteraceae bacterium]